MSGSTSSTGGVRPPHGSEPASTPSGVRPHTSDFRRRSASAFESVAAFVRERAWTLAVWASMLVWTLVLFAIVRDHYVHFRLARFDLGNMVQTVWSTAHGRPLEMTSGPTGEQITRLGAHVDPILVGLAPLWIAVPSPLTLVAVQIAAVALGALPLFWLARRHLGSERAAGLLAVTYLIYPWTAWTAADAFHPVTLAIPLFLFCIWFLDTDRLVPFTLCAILAASTGELIGLVVATLGVWFALARGRRRAGVAIAAAGTAWTLIALRVIVPAFSGGASIFYSAYDEVGGSPSGIVKTAFTDPLAILSAATRGSDVLYVVLLAVPLAGAFVLGPGLAAVALPQLAANLLASFNATTDPHAHYVAGILPFLFAAIAVGLARFTPMGRVRGAGLVLTVSLAATVMVGPWPGALGGTPNWYRVNTSAEAVAVRRAAIALVPDGVPVSSTNRFGAHLSARRYIYSVPLIGRADWIVLDVSDEWIPQTWGGQLDAETLRTFRERIEQSAEWRKVFDQDGVLVFRREQA